MPTAALAPAAAPIREFRAAVEYRRCLLYVAIGGCLIAGLIIFLPRPANAPPPSQQIAFCAVTFIGLPAAAWLYLTAWRLRVDHVGLWRKRLGFWSCWTWKFIETERVFFDRRHGYLWCNSRPWSDRLLGFAVLAPTDAEFVLEVFLRLAGAPDDQAKALANTSTAAAKITIRTTRWTRIEIDRDGLATSDGWQEDYHSWNSVSEVRIERTEQQQAVVHRFRIRLASGSKITGDLMFLWVDGVQDWVPHKKDNLWLPSLQGLVPADKWRCLQTWGDSQDAEEAEWRLAHWRVRQIWFRRIKRYLPPLPPMLLGWKFIPGMWVVANDPFFPQPWKTIAILCGLYTMFQPALLFWVLGRSGERALESKLKDAEAELVALLTRLTPAGQCVAPVSERT